MFDSCYLLHVETGHAILCVLSFTQINLVPHRGQRGRTVGYNGSSLYTVLSLLILFPPLIRLIIARIVLIMTHPHFVLIHATHALHISNTLHCCHDPCTHHMRYLGQLISCLPVPCEYLIDGGVSNVCVECARIDHPDRRPIARGHVKCYNPRAERLP